MKQITDLDDLAGKTIDRAIGFGDENLGLVFTDGTCFYICPFNGYDGCDATLEWDEEPDDDHKVELSLMSREEYDRLKAEQKAREEARRQERERAEYARLKAKFEGGDP